MTDLLNPPTVMLRTIGSQPTSMPKGFFKAVQFPILLKLDEKTADRRLLLSTGADVRALPLSIKFMSVTSDYGHIGAEVSGALFEVTIDPEHNLASGFGFLLDDENGHRHARLIHTGAMRGNSVDLTEVRARFVEDLDTGDYWIEFTQFKIGATTGVATPAFADAHATVDELTDEELMASLGDPMEPLVVEYEEFSTHVIGEPEEELTASHSTPFSAFYVPEAEIPHKIIIDNDLNVYGHLALADSCWGDDADHCLRPPRPLDGYASFNQPGVLTERGMVETGPIFAFGGHRKARSARTIEEAYGGIENAWADVRVIEGKHGPWLSGKVRPGIPDDVIYAARASRISGHWVNNKLRAIVSVNAEAFNVPGSGPERELTAGFAYATDDNEVTELIASFPDCAETPVQNTLTFAFSGDADMVRVAEALADLPGIAPWSATMTAVPVVPGPVDFVEPDELRKWADQRLAALLEDDRDGEP